jgi:hypothetical protein
MSMPDGSGSEAQGSGRTSPQQGEQGESFSIPLGAPLALLSGRFSGIKGPSVAESPRSLHTTHTHGNTEHGAKPPFVKKGGSFPSPAPHRFNLQLQGIQHTQSLDGGLTGIASGIGMQGMSEEERQQVASPLRTQEVSGGLQRPPTRIHVSQ